MAKVVTLGEIMLRLSPNGQDRFIQTDIFRIIPGGGEANVAISCANYGHDAYFVSKLPEHEIGQIAVNALRRYGVNTKYIARGGNRVGLYYCETKDLVTKTFWVVVFPTGIKNGHKQEERQDFFYRMSLSRQCSNICHSFCR